MTNDPRLCTCGHAHAWHEDGPCAAEDYCGNACACPAFAAAVVATRADLLARLRALTEERNRERAHRRADGLLLAYLADEEIAGAFAAIQKWYA